MPTPRIRSDYAVLQTIIQTFAKEANDLKQVLTRLKQSTETLRGGDWVGTGATAFYQEMDTQMLPATGRLVAALTNAGRTTQQMLQIMQNAERDAAMCFRGSGAGTMGGDQSVSVGGGSGTSGGDQTVSVGGGASGGGSGGGSLGGDQSVSVGGGSGNIGGNQTISVGGGAMEERNTMPDAGPTINAPSPATPPATGNPQGTVTALVMDVIDDKAMNSPWKQVTNFSVTNGTDARSPEAYASVIDQFDVENSYPNRYKAGTSGLSDTRCNIFAGDVMRAMGVPLPTKGDLGVGAGKYKNSDPMTANANMLNAWLNNADNGWRKIDTSNPADLAILREHLAAGKPALASMTAAKHGHIGVLRPDGLPETLTAENYKDLHIAQAGRNRYNDTTLGTGFGSSSSPELFIHD